MVTTDTDLIAVAASAPRGRDRSHVRHVGGLVLREDAGLEAFDTDLSREMRAAGLCGHL